MDASNTGLTLGLAENKITRYVQPRFVEDGHLFMHSILFDYIAVRIEVISAIHWHFVCGIVQ